MESLYFIDLIGTFVFAISGVMAAIKHRLDLFGATILAFATAVGGGSLRDVLIGSTPVGWMTDHNYLMLILLAVPICFFFKSQLQKLRKTFFLFDTIGIALFTILGFEKTLAMGLSPSIAILMGVVSAVFGGVIRDILTNQVPLIFHKEVYALACLAGALMHFALSTTFGHHLWVVCISISVVIIIRVLAVKYRWHVPFNA